jgi:DNA polymerase III epsilon subunit-like protein
MLLFVDCETNGLPDYKHPWNWDGQPRLVQLAALLLASSQEKDGTYQQIRELNCVIRPAGWTIPPKATAIHGITTEYALAFGVPIDHAMAKLQGMIIDADEPTVHPSGGKIIAHNLQFDTHIILGELNHLGMPLAPFGLLRPFCTMRTLTNRMRLPGGPRGEHKWPTLDEAWHFVHPDRLPADPAARHTAMGDVLMCRDVYLAGRERGWWS